MDYLKENGAVISAILLILVLVLLVVAIVLISKLVKNLVTKRFSFHDLKEVDKDTNTAHFAIVVANRSLSDVSVSAIGVVSGLKFFDFQKNYRDGDRVAEKPVIPQRASIKLTIGIEELESLIFSNAENGKLKKTCVYVLDSSGNMSKCRARGFHRILKADFRALMKQKRAEAKRAGFEETAEEIRASEAAGKRVTFGERIRLVFRKFPREEAAALSGPEAEAREEKPAPEQAAEPESVLSAEIEAPEPIEEPERNEESEE